MMLKSIAIEEYMKSPTTYNLPRAMAHMKVGDVVVMRPNEDIYPVKHPDAPDGDFAGMLINDTFPYGVALVASQMVDFVIQEVWIVV